MPRGRKKTIPVVENIDEKIAAVEDEIASLTEALKAKKAERKELAKAKLEADKAAALKKAEEEKEAILAAVAASGKTVDEILDMRKKEKKAPRPQRVIEGLELHLDYYKLAGQRELS